ncbi:MAG: RNA polymerase sigma factor [Vicinamibacteria bacterium]
MSNDELAEALGVSVNAAKIRVHRARQALRTLLEPHFRPNPS